MMEVSRDKSGNYIEHQSGFTGIYDKPLADGRGEATLRTALLPTFLLLLETAGRDGGAK